MRLLLDEHYSQLIAEKLREQGHDVVAVAERPDLVGAKESELFARMCTERRAIVTENWGDFQLELRNAAATGVSHYGVLLTSRRRLPRSKQTIGVYVQVLGDFLGRHPAEDAILDSYRWLPDQPR